MQFRRLLLDDVARLSEFKCATRRDPQFERLVNRMLRTELADAMQESERNLRAFVAEDDKSILGVAVLEPADNGRQWELSALGVSADARRRGIGNALMRFAVADTPEAQFEPVLFRVHERNTRMWRLLRSVGVEQVEEPDMWGYAMYAAEPIVIVENLETAIARTEHVIGRESIGAGASLS